MITNSLQDFAAELSEFFGEPKNFGLFIGLIKNNGQQKVREMFSKFKDLRRQKDINSHYFVAMFRKEKLSTPSY